jgi:hypothetical protein
MAKWEWKTKANKLTLEADPSGIWLVSLEDDGPNQIACIPWRRIYEEMEYYAAKEKARLWLEKGQ